MFWNIISLIVGISGTIAGIIGTYISYKTMVNTKKIEAVIEEECIKRRFNAEYKAIIGVLNRVITLLGNKDVNRHVIIDIWIILNKIKKYSDGQDWKTKYIIDNCYEYIDSNYHELINTKSIIKDGKPYLENDILNDTLLKKAIEVKGAVEKESVNYGYRQN